MERFIIKKEELNLKENKSGFNSTLGGFFIIDRNSNIPHSEYVEVEIVKEILDKRNKKVKIVSLKEHNHSIAVPLDKYYRSEYCLICTECSYRKKHNFKYYYEITESKHKKTKRCDCGYQETIEEFHDFKYEFKIITEENKVKIIKTKECECGYKTESIEEITKEEIEHEIEKFNRFKKERNGINIQINILEEEKRKIEKDIEENKFIEINLRNEERFKIKHYGEEVLVHSLKIDTENDKLYVIFHQKKTSFLFKSEIEIYTEPYSEMITIPYDPNELNDNLKNLIKEKEKNIETKKEKIKTLKEKLDNISVQINNLYEKKRYKASEKFKKILEIKNIKEYEIEEIEKLLEQLKKI